jgi:hypothetical protein
VWRVDMGSRLVQSGQAITAQFMGDGQARPARPTRCVSTPAPASWRSVSSASAEPEAPVTPTIKRAAVMACSPVVSERTPSNARRSVP